MGINGSIGRARKLRAIRRERTAEAAAMGIDTSDRAAMAAWERERFNSLFGSIREQLRCGCSGDKHDVITGWRGQTT